MKITTPRLIGGALFYCAVGFGYFENGKRYQAGMMAPVNLSSMYLRTASE